MIKRTVNGRPVEPKSSDPQVLEKRMQAIYAVDKQAPSPRSKIEIRKLVREVV